LLLGTMAESHPLRTGRTIKEPLMRTLIASSSLMIALLAAPAALGQASPVCLKDVSGMANCAFQTMAQCEAAKGINVAAQCIARADVSSGLTPTGTTGQGSPRQADPLPRPSPQR
jgi:hypothetical protein